MRTPTMNSVIPEHDTLTREQYVRLRDFPTRTKVKVRRSKKVVKK